MTSRPVPRPIARPVPRSGALLTALLCALLAAVALATPARAATPRPATPAGLPTAIEGMADYVGQVSCDPRTRPGTKSLATLLARTYSSYGGGSWATTYACGTDGGQSEHYDGRAIDWMVNIHNSRQHAAATAFLSWLLATDRAGNRYAMARRLGVMYVIYDNRMWGSWSGTWEPYNGCAKLRSSADDNACHRTHMHISLSWDGAMGRTSFWTKRVPTVTDYGPCRPADLNWAPRYRKANDAGCARYRTVSAAKGSSALKKSLVTYSGAELRAASSGPAVTAVQRALKTAASGSFTATTTRAVTSFQRRHHLSATGVLDQPTWRALLASVR